MLFERHGCKQRGLETVRVAVAHDAPEAPKRGAPAGLVVVGELIEIPLDQQRRPQPRNQAPLACAEKGDGSLFHDHSAASCSAEMWPQTVDKSGQVLRK